MIIMVMLSLLFIVMLMLMMIEENLGSESGARFIGNESGGEYSLLV